MLEHIGSGYEDLHNDLTTGRNSAWQRYILAGDATNKAPAAYYKVDTRNPDDPKISLDIGTKFLRQYFRFIHRGAVRIRATAANITFAPVAFINPDGSYVVVVKAGGGGSFIVRGLPSGSYGIKYTTDAQSDVNLPDVMIGERQDLTTGIPTTGVLTVYGLYSRF
jgi:hypothetical protein